MSNPILYQNELKNSGMTSARNALINRKQLFLDDYLEKKNLFSIDEETCEMKLSAMGAFHALSYLNFLQNSG